MAKKSSTVYLEQKFWDMIEDYCEKNGFSSRNDGLTLILSEWNILKNIDFNNINITVNGSKEVIYKEVEDNKETIEPPEQPKEEIEKEVDPRLKEGLMKIIGTMKPEE